MNRLLTYFNNNTLKSILLLAIGFRIVAAVFSAGYGFHDDHFLVVEAAQSWVEDNDWNDWMPEAQKRIYPGREPVPEGHSLFYPGLHYVVFSITDALGFTNPGGKAMLVRFLHALFSLIAVSLAYKITLHYSHKRAAVLSGMLMALLWCMPFFSVRNMVEIFAYPFILLGIWQVVSMEGKPFKVLPYLLAGILMGIAFSVRFQTLIIPGGVGLVLLFRKQLKETIWVALGVLLMMILIQGGIDFFIWGKPFAEFIAYVEYNITHRFDYGSNNYFMYIGVLAGLFLFPLGLFLSFGWLASFKKYAMLFWPSFLFFAFHTYFVNKQERFILPILPLFIIAGVLGWFAFMDKSKFHNKRPWVFKYSMLFFWAINFIMLPVLTVSYSKRARCESMAYFNNKDISHVLVEESNRHNATMFPVFYAGKNIDFYNLTSRSSFTDSLPMLNKAARAVHSVNIDSPKSIEQNKWIQPQYILFVGEDNLERRLERMQAFYPDMQHVETIKMGLVDKLMGALNSSNNNQLIYIYQANAAVDNKQG